MLAEFLSLLLEDGPGTPQSSLFGDPVTGSTLVGTRRNHGKTKDGTGLLEIYCLVI